MKEIIIVAIIAIMFIAIVERLTKRDTIRYHDHHVVKCVEDDEIQEYVIVIPDGVDREVYGQQFCSSIKDL